MVTLLQYNKHIYRPSLFTALGGGFLEANSLHLKGESRNPYDAIHCGLLLESNSKGGKVSASGATCDGDGSKLHTAYKSRNQNAFALRLGGGNPLLMGKYYVILSADIVFERTMKGRDNRRQWDSRTR